MNDIKLNLARKWRSQNFDQIIGQDLSVRILKNSLYKGQFFPVYLLSGQRGSGKTTTARVFAAALNCHNLSAFQSNPQNQSVPCLVCRSCIAMVAGNHPDFVEMDAASNTGVDNVRTIIEASSYLPLLGAKKIYLIDEAHMLSKAAFNALLKMLEEPPRSVVFMLATTDPHKILDTVRSRCFQLVFKPINQDVLVSHLALVCDTEGVVYEREGLQLLAAQSEGSARDALNLVEQVRFASKGVTASNVLHVLGRLDDAHILQLVSAAICKQPADVLGYIKKIELSSYSAEYVWQRISDLGRALIWSRYGVSSPLFVLHAQEVQQLAFSCSVAQLIKFMNVLYEHELLFSRTTAKHALIEMVLLSLCGFASSSDSGGGASSAPQHAAAPVGVETDDESELQEGEEPDDDEDDREIDSNDCISRWNRCIKQLQDSNNDPVISSVLRQASTVSYDAQTSIVTLEFPKNLAFFSDMLADVHASWRKVFKDVFGQNAHISAQFTGESPVLTVAPSAVTVQASTPIPLVKNTKPVSTQTHTRPAVPHKMPSGMSQPFKGGYQKRASKNWGPTVDVSDVATWQKANLLLRFFPGTIHEITE